MKPIQFSLKGSKASSLSKMNQEKIATFAFGNTTKSKYQSEKEQKEEREKRELEEAMKLYKDFEEDSFDFHPKKKTKTSNFFSDNFSQLSDEDQPPPPSFRKGKPKKKIDEFLEKIKSEQEKVENSNSNNENDLREKRTNLFIVNLSRSVTNADLYNFFSKYGTIASVKIKVPKDTDRKTNVGFVNYTNPKFAEIARNELDGKEFRGLPIKISWGRDQPDILESHFLYSKQLHYQNRNYKGELLDDKIVYVKPPKLEMKKKIIDLLAEYVSKCGSVFEDRILQRERNNNDFTFLLHEGSEENEYYRWRVYSLCNGDSFYNWNNEPFELFVNGSKWIAPSYEDMGISQSKYEHMRNQSIMKLTDKEYEVFSDLLLEVDLSRKSIRNAMVYCIEHSEAGSEIVNMICENILNDNTNIPSKIAKVYLISDILYNSSCGVKGASGYRSEIEYRLADLFEELGKIYRRIDGHLTSVGMKERMLNILNIWSDWSLFPRSYILGLEASLFYDPKIDSTEHNDDLHIEDMNESKLKGECLKNGISMNYIPSELIEKLNRNRSYINRKYGKEKENKELIKEGEKEEELEEYDIIKSYEKKINVKETKGNWVEVSEEEEDIDGEAIEDEDIDGDPLEDSEYVKE